MSENKETWDVYWLDQNSWEPRRVQMNLWASGKYLNNLTGKSWLAARVNAEMSCGSRTRVLAASAGRAAALCSLLLLLKKRHRETGPSDTPQTSGSRRRLRPTFFWPNGRSFQRPSRATRPCWAQEDAESLLAWWKHNTVTKCKSGPSRWWKDSRPDDPNRKMRNIQINTVAPFNFTAV